MDIWLFNNSHLCQFIEIVRKIINWYMKNAVLYKHIIQVENKNMGLKVVGHKHTIAPPPPPPNKKKWGGTCPSCPPPPITPHHHSPTPPHPTTPASYASDIYFMIICYYKSFQLLVLELLTRNFSSSHLKMSLKFRLVAFITIV